MVPRPFDLASLTIFIFMLACGQLLFKQMGNSIRGLPLLEGLITGLHQPIFYLALTLYGTATLLWIWILSRIPLAQAYPWVGVSVVIVPLLSIAIYGETVRPVFWLGVALIAVGMLLAQYGAIAD